MMKITKNIITLSIAVAFSVNANAQNQFSPVRSVSAMSTYQETPVEMVTGLPNISFPIMGIPGGQGISEKVTLSYNPNTVNGISDVGSGWSLFSGGVISRTIIDGIDERYNTPQAIDYQKNDFDDIYYYNLPNGINGKFRIYRSEDQFTIVDFSNNNVKIDYTRTAATATLILDSFTITDDQGTKYLFKDYSENLSVESESLYKSAFFLTSIKSAANVEIMTYQYQKDSRFIPGTNIIMYKSCKLKKINSPGLGNITFDYAYDDTLEETSNDPYSVSKITLENDYGKVISQYYFDYNYNLFPEESEKKRFLKKIRKADLNNPTGNPLEATAFEYESAHWYDPLKLSSEVLTCEQLIFNPYVENFEGGTRGLLKKIIQPSGGVTEYNFEANEFFLNKNTPEYTAKLTSFVDPYIQAINLKDIFNYSNSQNDIITWTVSGDPAKKKKVYLKFFAEPRRILSPIDPGGDHDTDPGDGSTPINPNLRAEFKINNGTIPFQSCKITESPFEFFQEVSLEVYPGTYTIQITPGLKGNIKTYELVTNPPPYKNIGYTGGRRIKNVKTYKSVLDTIPENIVSYSYQLFSNNTDTSGLKFMNESSRSGYDYSEYVLYKNIRVTSSTKDGYADYYFKTPDDYPDTSYTVNGTSYPLKHYYNITSKGLLEKSVIYNALNQKASSTDYEYTLQYQSSGLPAKSLIGYIRPGTVTYTKEIQRSYFGTSQVLENTIESEFGNMLRNFQLSKIKTVSSDGDVYEKTIKYPDDLITGGQPNPYTHLWNANMKGIPVNTTEKRNGKMVSSIDVKFDNGSFYPTSLVSTNPNDNSKKTIAKYDMYDAKGNLTQYTENFDVNGVGIPVSLIYGYNRTLPILKAKGATLNDLKWIPMPSDWEGFDTLSNQDMDEASEQKLIKYLDEYRTNPAMKPYFVTTFTYDPLVGTTSVTPPTGMREIYKYDKNNRIQYVVDVNGNILTESRYNTKPQP